MALRRRSQFWYYSVTSRTVYGSTVKNRFTYVYTCLCETCAALVCAGVCVCVYTSVISKLFVRQHVLGRHSVFNPPPSPVPFSTQTISS